MADPEIKGARLNLIGVLREEWGGGVLSSTRAGDVRDVGMIGVEKILSKLWQLQSCAGRWSSESVGLLPAGAARMIQEGALAGQFCSVERIRRVLEGVAEQC